MAHTMSTADAPATQAPPILHLSTVVGSSLRDADGERLGKVEDLIVRLGGVGYPPITGFLVTVAGKTSYVGVERVSDVGAEGVVLRKAKLDLRRFERRPEEVLLKRDLLDRQLINVEGARLVRANEIELALVAGSWRVVGVDTGPRGGLRRLLPKGLVPRLGRRRAVRRARADGPPARATPEAREATPGTDRRSRRGCFTARGRGDHPSRRR
jgi:magnesium transporter